MSSISEFQDGWTNVLLKDICERITKGSTPTSYGYKYQDEGIRFIKAENIDIEGIASSTTNYIDDETHEFLKRSILHDGDLLFSIAGTIGRVGRMRQIDLPANTNQALAIIRLKPGVVYQKYLFYYLKSDAIQKESLQKIVGVGRANLSLTNIGEFEIPIAPPDQQKRIVAEIEKQFSRLDEAVVNLKRVKANLKRYKAAVLKAAVEGKLTEEWRRENPNIEPADKLLERILAERREKWQGRGKYKEPAAPDTTDLPELPEGWVWSNFEQLSEAIPNSLKAGPFGSALKKSFYVPEGYKVFGQEQVIREDPYYGDYFIDEGRYESLKSCAVKPGDMLISLVGTIGRVLILPEDSEPGIINPRLVKVSFNTDIVDPLYIKAFLQSPFVKYLFSLASHGGTMDILNLGILKGIPVPIPSLLEQKAILNELASFSSVEERLEGTVGANQARSTRLRQSILKKAFSGNLI